VVNRAAVWSGSGQWPVADRSDCDGASSCSLNDELILLWAVQGRSQRPFTGPPVNRPNPRGHRAFEPRTTVIAAGVIDRRSVLFQVLFLRSTRRAHDTSLAQPTPF